MSFLIDIQIASKSQMLPHPSQIKEWLEIVLEHEVDTAEMTVRLVDEKEMTQLNSQYRKKHGPTNVLAFPYEPIPGVASNYMGDVIICAPVVEFEANKIGLPEINHWAHMVVHGTLHLMGFDHDTDEAATDMESKEIMLLKKLGFPSPYLSR